MFLALLLPATEVLAHFVSQPTFSKEKEHKPVEYDPAGLVTRCVV